MVKNSRTLNDWLSPATGDVIEKKVINGQRAVAATSFTASWITTARG